MLNPLTAASKSSGWWTVPSGMNWITFIKPMCFYNTLIFLPHPVSSLPFLGSGPIAHPNCTLIVPQVSRNQPHLYHRNSWNLLSGGCKSWSQPSWRNDHQKETVSPLWALDHLSTVIICWSCSAGFSNTKLLGSTLKLVRIGKNRLVTASSQNEVHVVPIPGNGDCCLKFNNCTIDFFNVSYRDLGRTWTDTQGSRTHRRCRGIWNTRWTWEKILIQCLNDFFYQVTCLIGSQEYNNTSPSLLNSMV